MNTSLHISCKQHRYPTEIISHGLWLYFRFALRYY